MRLYTRIFIALIVALGFLMMAATHSMGQQAMTAAQTLAFGCQRLEHLVEVIGLLQSNKQPEHDRYVQQLQTIRSKGKPACNTALIGHVKSFKVVTRYTQVPFRSARLDIAIVQVTYRNKTQRYILLDRPGVQEISL